MSSFVLGVYCYYIVQLRGEVEYQKEHNEKMAEGFNKFLKDEKLESKYLKWRDK